MNQHYATARRNFTQPLPAIPAPRQRLDGLGDLTTELDEFPVTLDLNQDAAPIFAKETTIELALEEISIALPLAAIDPFQPGQVIRDRYVIEAVIGQGGFAIVYRARDLRRDTTEGQSPHVALKVLRPELRARPQAIARLKREFRQTHSLSHPNIVRVFDLDAHADAWFIVMELLEGETLAARLHQLEGRPMSCAQAHTLLAACANALSFAHQLGIAHGDFKPTNLFVLHDGSMRLIDFGSSSDLNLGASGDALDQSDRVATPAYASPQVLARELAQPRDDLFSFACVAFEMLAGTHPFAHRSSLAVQAGNHPVAESAALSPQQMTVLKGGLAWRREDRPDSVDNFFRCLTTPEPSKTEQENQLAERQTESALVTPEASASDSPLDAVVFSDPEPPPASISEQKVSAADMKLASLTIATAMAELSDSHAAMQPSSQRMLAESPLKATANITPPPAIQTAPRRSQTAAPPIANSMSLFLAPSSKRFLSYGWLILFVLMYIGFLLLRSPNADMGSSPQAQSTAPQAERVHTDAPLPTKTAATPQESGREQRLLAAPIPSANLAPVKKPTKPIAANQPTSAVSFETSTMTVTKRAVSAAIILKRVNGHSGRLRVAWRLKAGSATAGRDFDGPLSGVAEFADLQQKRTLFVPLINNPERSGDRTFAVELTNVSKDAPIRSVTVTIRDTD